MCWNAPGFTASLCQAEVIDGVDGHLLWTAEFVCPRLVLEASAMSTSTGLSAFVFWASEPIKAETVPKATVSLPREQAYRGKSVRLYE